MGTWIWRVYDVTWHYELMKWPDWSRRKIGTPYPSCSINRGSDCSAVRWQEKGTKEIRDSNQSTSHVVSQGCSSILLFNNCFDNLLNKILWSG